MGLATNAAEGQNCVLVIIIISIIKIRSVTKISSSVTEIVRVFSQVAINY